MMLYQLCPSHHMAWRVGARVESGYCFQYLPAGTPAGDTCPVCNSRGIGISENEFDEFRRNAI